MLFSCTATQAPVWRGVNVQADALFEDICGNIAPTLSTRVNPGCYLSRSVLLEPHFLHDCDGAASDGCGIELPLPDCIDRGLIVPADRAHDPHAADVPSLADSDVHNDDSVSVIECWNGP